MSFNAAILTRSMDAIVAACPAAAVTVRIGGKEAAGVRADPRQDPLNTEAGIETGQTASIYIKSSLIAPGGISDGDKFELLETGGVRDTWTHYRAQSAIEYGATITVISYRTTGAT